MKLNATTYYTHRRSVYSLTFSTIGSPPSNFICYYRSYLCDLLTRDYSVMTWLLNSLEEKISEYVMFLTTAKEMCDTLKVMYGNEKNTSRVFEIYERLFELKHGDRFVPEFYGELEGLIDELDMHQPPVTDVATLRRYRQDLAVSKFLSGLSPILRPNCGVRYWEEIVFSH